MTGKYVRKADADRLTAKLKAALAALDDEFHRAIGERTKPGMTGPEARAAAEAEVARVLKAVDQVKAAMEAQLDDAAVHLDDGAA